MKRGPRDGFFGWKIFPQLLGRRLCATQRSQESGLLGCPSSPRSTHNLQPCAQPCGSVTFKGKALGPAGQEQARRCLVVATYVLRPRFVRGSGSSDLGEPGLTGEERQPPTLSDGFWGMVSEPISPRGEKGWLQPSAHLPRVKIQHCSLFAMLGGCPHSGSHPGSIAVPPGDCCLKERGTG